MSAKDKVVKKDSPERSVRVAVTNFPQRNESMVEVDLPKLLKAWSESADYITLVNSPAYQREKKNWTTWFDAQVQYGHFNLDYAQFRYDASGENLRAYGSISYLAMLNEAIVSERIRPDEFPSVPVAVLKSQRELFEHNFAPLRGFFPVMPVAEGQTPSL